MRFRQAGIYRQEPGDEVPRERPQRMTRLILRAIAEDVFSPLRGAELLGMPLSQFLESQNELYQGAIVAVGA